MTSSSESFPTPPPPEPSSLRVDCPNCAHAFAIRPSMIGKAVVCPHCQQSVALPPVSPAPEATSGRQQRSPTAPPAAPPILPPADASEIPTLNPKQESNLNDPPAPPIASADLSAPLAPREIEPPPIENEVLRRPPRPAADRDQKEVSRRMAEAPSGAATEKSSARRSRKRPKSDREKPESSRQADASQKQRRTSSQRERPAPSRPTEEDDLPLLPPGAAESTQTSHPVDELLPPTRHPTSETESDLAATPAHSTDDSEAASVTRPQAADEVHLPDGEGGFIVASSRIVTVRDGAREIKLQRLDRQSQNQRRSLTSLVVFGACVVTLVVSIVLLRWLFGG